MWTCELIDQSEANPKAKNKGKYVKEIKRVERKQKKHYRQGIELKIDRVRKICM